MGILDIDHEHDHDHKLSQEKNFSLVKNFSFFCGFFVHLFKIGQMLVHGLIYSLFRARLFLRFTSFT